MPTVYVTFPAQTLNIVCDVKQYFEYFEYVGDEQY